MDPVRYDFTNNFGEKMPLLVALLKHLLAKGEIARHVIHGIFGCLATGVAKVPERLKNSIKEHICYINIKLYFSFDPFFIFLKVIRLVALLIG